MTEIIINTEKIKQLEEYIKPRTPFKTGSSSVAITLTGLIEPDKQYICWKENDLILIKEKRNENKERK